VPIDHASVYLFDNAEEGAAIHEGRKPGFFYGRMGTPTQAALERAMAQLEGGEACLATASGMSAIAVAALSVLESGDHLVAQGSLYTSTSALFAEILPRLGIEVSRVASSYPEDYQAAIRENTKAIYVETPANPALTVMDIAAISHIARSHGLMTMVDNTFATPFNQRPLALGADIVIHSASKYLGGHGDVIAGIIVGPESAIGKARWKIGRLLGPSISPQTAWLVLRGIRTLAIRMEQHNKNAARLAVFLAGERKVRQVNYPGLPSHPQHETARRQMKGFGGVISFDVGSAEKARLLADSLVLCGLGVSLGDVSTLVQHCASMTQSSLPPKERTRAGVTDGLLRISVGIEDYEDIEADLRQALAKL
jgi:methionine-gamma-lyase